MKLLEIFDIGDIKWSRWVWVFLLYGCPLWGWGQGTEGDCRVKDADLQPIIHRFNPFFTEHQWVDFSKQETARMDKHRLLMILQEGCKRHHTTFNLYISKEIVKDSAGFWIQEAQNMMRAVFDEKREFRSFQQEFEEIFAEKMEINGANREFNFPVGSRNFICEVENSVSENALIHIEMIEYIFEEVVKEARKSNAQDDGWYIQPVRKPRPPANLPVGSPLPPKP